MPVLDNQPLSVDHPDWDLFYTAEDKAKHKRAVEAVAKRAVKDTGSTDPVVWYLHYEKTNRTPLGFIHLSKTERDRLEKTEEFKAADMQRILSMNRYDCPIGPERLLDHPDVWERGGQAALDALYERLDPYAED